MHQCHNVATFSAKNRKVQYEKGQQGKEYKRSKRDGEDGEGKRSGKGH